jgi:hypothetical protein
MNLGPADDRCPLRLFWFSTQIPKYIGIEFKVLHALKGQILILYLEDSGIMFLRNIGTHLRNGRQGVNAV